ncbi:MAG: succinate dehydrogenase, hydrophobic membrane anchor protein [Nitrospirota bacterium]
MKEVTQWFLQRVTGFFLFLVLMVHFYIMHFEDHSAIEHASIVERFSNPYWITFDIFFLAILSYHGFNGLWRMVIEYIRSERLLKVVQILIIFLTIIIFSFGTFILLK